MADKFCIVICAFGRGMASLGAGWDWSIRPSRPVQIGIGRHFSNVGRQMSIACQKYMDEHPEIKVYA